MKTISIKRIALLAAIILGSSVTYAQPANPSPSVDFGGTNYVVTSTSLDTLGDSIFDIRYYDGLGYPCQTVMSDASPDGASLVTPVVYDNMRRPDATSYLPYPVHASNPLQFRPGAVTELLSWYASEYQDGSHPFSSTVFETGVNGRPLTVMKPGDEFRSANRAAEMEYGINDGTDLVLKLSNDEEGSTVHVGGYYSAGTLYKVSSTDEDGNESAVFSDAFGKTVLTRRMLDDCNVDTYYVYDLRDSLRYVIQPEGVPLIQESIASCSPDDFLDPLFLDRYCFSWKRDSWGNVIESHVPGGGTTWFRYDDRDRPVLCWDSQMAAAGVATRRQYDSLDRLVKEEYGELSLPQMTFSPVMVSRRLAYYSPLGTGIPSESGLEFVPDEVATLADIRTDRCLNHLSYEYVCAAPKTSEIVNPVTAEDHLERAYYYDGKGRLIQTVEVSSDGWKNIFSTGYDFVGNVVATRESHSDTDNISSVIAPDVLLTRYDVDRRGRILSCERTIIDHGGTHVLDTVDYCYDALGRLTSKSVGDKIAQTYDYDLRGWTRGITATRDTSVLFSETMRFENPQMPGSTALYSGNISEIETVQYGNPKDIYAYSYDGLSRLTDASHFIGGPLGASNTNTERLMEYDLNGNLLWIQRCGATPSSFVNLDFSYSGNRLTVADDWNTGLTYTYSHDLNGNRTSDARSGLDFSWNLLNLPCEVSDSSGTMIMRYTYLSDGTKVSSLDASGNGVFYRGNFVYRKRGQSVTIDNIAWDEGRIQNGFRPLFSPSIQTLSTDARPADGQISSTAESPLGLRPHEPELIVLWNDHWYVRDHLGSVRSIVNLSDSTGAAISDIILEQNDYLPFGTKAVKPSEDSQLIPDFPFVPIVPRVQDNNYRFAGKEEYVFGNGDSSLLDFGARYYDPWSCQWTAVDPLAEKYSGMSPYNYCIGDPISLVDSDGKDIVLSGDLKDQALSQLQARMNNMIELHLDIESGQVSYSVNDGKKPRGAAKRMIKMIDDHSITVNITTTNKTNTSEGNLFVGGAFLGNTVTVDSNGDNNVVANQLVNPNVLGRADAHTNTMGKMMMHEVTEAYSGARISQKSGVSASIANKVESADPFSIYNRAHSRATPQTPVKEIMYDSFGDRTDEVSKARKIEWIVSKRGKPCIIQTLF